MAPRARAKSPTPSQRLEELEVRAGQVDAILDGIEARLERVLALEPELARLRELVLESAAQAQDAHTMSSGLDARINHLTLAVAEGIQHVDRAEKRIHGVVTRARRLLRESGLESPGLEAEASQLHELDGGARDEEGVPDMQPSVVEAPPALVDRLRAIGLSR